eukprot:5568216-Amphidinium_carterae.1
MRRSPSSISLGSLASGASVTGSTTPAGIEEMGSEEGERAETMRSLAVAAVPDGGNGCGKKLSAYTADEMVSMLSAVEPGVFAKEVLKARLGSSRARYLAKDKLYPYFSFVFGMRSRDEVPPLASERLHMAMSKYSTQMNRPGRDLSIPTEWAEQGVFRLSVKGSDVRLENSRVGEAKLMKEKGLDKQWDGRLRIPCLKYFHEEAVRSFANWWVNDGRFLKSSDESVAKASAVLGDKGTEGIRPDAARASPAEAMSENQIEPVSP